MVATAQQRALPLQNIQYTALFAVSQQLQQHNREPASVKEYSI
jgi:hypothetical protein